MGATALTPQHETARPVYLQYAQPPIVIDVAVDVNDAARFKVRFNRECALTIAGGRDTSVNPAVTQI